MRAAQGVGDEPCNIAVEPHRLFLKGRDGDAQGVLPNDFLGRTGHAGIAGMTCMTDFDGCRPKCLRGAYKPVACSMLLAAIPSAKADGKPPSW